MKKYLKILKGSSVVILAAAFLMSGFFVANNALADSTAITKINFTSPAQTVNINTPSGILTTQTQNTGGTPEKVSETTTLNLSSTSVTGEFSSNVDTWIPVTTLTMASSTANRNFYYRDSTAGTYTLTVTAAGKTWTAATQIITVVTPPNNPPVLTSIGAQSVNELSVLTFTAVSTDVDGGAPVYSLTGAPTGAEIVSSTGLFTWTPTEAQGPGSYTFDVVVSDGNSTDSETITVTVNEVNVAPTANDQSVTTNEDVAKDITLTATDTDLPANTLTYSVVSGPAHGILSGTAPDLTYTPNANYNESDSFTFTVSDDGGATNNTPATVSITITPVNDVPSFIKGADQTVLEDAGAQSIAGWATAMSAGPSDESVQALNFIVTNNNNAPFSVQPAVAVDGTLTYTPAADANGSATVTISLHDNGGTENGGVDTSASQTFTITVTPVNDAPVISLVTIAPTDPKTNDILTANVTANDVDGDPLSYTYQWKKNNTVVVSMVSTLDLSILGNGDKNDSITVKVQANDFNDGGISNVYTSNPVTVQNSVPIAIAPTVPAFDEDTFANIILSGSDADGDSLTYTVTIQPAHGIITGTAPNLTYNPNLNYNGVDSFTFRANDGTADSVPATVSLTINPVNDKPVLTSISIIPADPKTNDILTANPVATDVDDDSLTYTYQWKKGDVVISGATSATLNLSVIGNGDKGDVITVKVIAHDTTLSSTSLTSGPVTVLNTTPVADAQTVSAFAEDTTQAITLTGSDADTDSFTFTIVAGPTNGTLGSIVDGVVIYTPNENYNGADFFTFKVYDGAAYSDPATVSLTVIAVNDAPTATNQSVITNEDTAKLITLVGSDIDGDFLTYSLVSGPTNGTAVLSGNQVTYTPNLNYNGSDSFTFKVNDGTVNSNIATVSITVTAVNDAPVLGTIGNKTVNELATLTFISTATDVENDTLTYSLTGTFPDGASIGAPSGIFSWTPTEAQGPGIYSITIQVSDSQAVDSETIKVTVTGAILTLTAPATATIIKSASLIAATNGKADSNAAVETAITGLTPIAVTLANTGDAASPNVRISPIGNTSGHIQFWAKDTADNWYDINVTGWGPVEGFSAPIGYSATTNVYAISNMAGEYTLTANLVLVSDSSIITTVTGTVTVNNAVPVLGTIGPKPVDELSALTFTAISTDADGDIPVYSLLTGTVPDGASIDSSSGVFTWTPTEEQGPGIYSITIQVSDGQAVDSKTITVTVNEVNVAPITSGQSVTTNEDTATGITLSVTDPDLPANTLTYTVTNPSNGILSGTAPNLTYTPNLNYNGSNSFTFKVFDGTIDSNIATVNITINAVNDVPVAVDDVATTNEDTPLTISQSSLLSNDTDTDGPSLSVSAVGNAVNGSVAISGSDVVFTPTLNFNGTASFEYTVSDGSLADVGLMTITVNAVNDVPVATTQSVTITEDVAKDIILSGSDADSDSLTYSIVDSPAHGTLTGTAPNLTYTPVANYNGSDSFTFKVNDGTAYSDPAIVSLTVTAVNDAPVITLTSPVGGEKWSGNKNITWTAEDIDEDTLTITIEKSLNGIVWTNIATGESNDGTYSWNTSLVSDGNYWIKVIVSDGTIQSKDSTISTISLDNTAPTIVSYLPSNNAVGVDPNTNITVIFSEDVNINADNVTISGEVGKTVSFVPVTKTATIDPTSSLANNSTYVITLTGVTDTAGNPLAETTWSFTTSGSYNVQLTQGWNLISMPVVPNNTAIGTVLGSAASSIEVVWAYDAVNDAWYVYRPVSPLTSNLASMTAGYGYWVNYTSASPATLVGPGNLFLEGNNLPPQKTLKAGWNLIGYYQKQDTDSIEAYYALWTLRNPDSGTSWWTMLMGYDNDSKQFTSLDYWSDMDPGKGYWILMGGKASDTYIYAPGVDSDYDY